MAEISEIKVKNIKGFGATLQSIKVSILPNKVNLLVAPNGWGKSSLTTAFESLRSNKIDVGKENKYKQDETLESELTIVYDGTSYTATSHKNEINNLFSCIVIHCDLYPKVVTHNMGAFSSSRGYLDIKDIEICSIPKRVELIYKFTSEKTSFGINGKILNNLTEYLRDRSNLSLFCKKEIIDSIKKMDGKKVSALINNIKTDLNLMSGTQDAIKSTVNAAIFSDINTIEAYVNLKETFCKGKTDIDAFTDIYQIIHFYKQNKTDISLYFKYDE